MSLFMTSAAKRDLKLLGITFVTIFVAELGDKTQLATLGFAVNTPDYRLLIFVAAGAALVASSLMGTLLGTLLARWMKPRLMNLVAGIIFVGCAIVFAWQFFASTSGDSATAAVESAASTQAAGAASGAPWEIFLATFAALFIAELGDKTQLATFSLAAGNRHARWTVFFGSSLALVLSTLLAVVAGAMLGHYFDQRYLTLAAAIVFAILGVVFLLGRAEKGKREFGWLVEEIERVYLDGQCRACPDFMMFLEHIRELDSETVNAKISSLLLPREQWSDTCAGTCRVDRLHAALHEHVGEPPPLSSSADSDPANGGEPEA